MINEPVGHVVQWIDGSLIHAWCKEAPPVGTPLYIHPVITPLTEDECEAIINRHDWFSKSWREMAKEIHDEILKKAKKL